MTSERAPLPPIYAVDDDEHDREMLTRQLTAAGITNSCRSFATGEGILDALIDVLRGAPMPLLCFVDVKMAGMSGLDVLRWIRAQDALRGMPVVMLSSSDALPLLAEALQLGAQAYLAKFPGPDQWREIIGTAERYASAAAPAPFLIPGNLLLDRSVDLLSRIAVSK